MHQQFSAVPMPSPRFTSGRWGALTVMMAKAVKMSLQK